jgi:anti-sigma B factor antagonist
MRETTVIQVTECGGAAVVRVLEKKLYQQAVPSFREEMLALSGERRCGVVLDLSGVAVMNSSALGVVILTHDRLQKQGGMLALCGLTPVLEEVFRRMHLYDLFPIVATVEEALEALRKAKKIPGQ